MDSSKRKRQRNKNIVDEYKLLHPCVICGESRIPCLDFHHKDGNKEDVISNLIYKHVSIIRLNSEIKKCIILCSNCHRMIHNF